MPVVKLLVLRGAHRGEPLVVSEVEVGLGAVVGDEHLAVLERAHRARVDVDVGVELLQGDLEPAALEDAADGCGGKSLAQRRHDAAGDEDVLGLDAFLRMSVGLREDPGHPLEIGGRVHRLGTKIRIDDDDRNAGLEGPQLLEPLVHARAGRGSGGSARCSVSPVGVDALVLAVAGEPARSRRQSAAKVRRRASVLRASMVGNRRPRKVQGLPVPALTTLTTLGSNRSASSSIGSASVAISTCEPPVERRDQPVEAGRGQQRLVGLEC